MNIIKIWKNLINTICRKPREQSSDLELNGMKKVKEIQNILRDQKKSRSVKKCITKLKTQNGKTITGVNPILKEVTAYYSNLYSSENIDPIVRR